MTQQNQSAAEKLNFSHERAFDFSDKSFLKEINTEMELLNEALQNTDKDRLQNWNTLARKENLVSSKKIEDAMDAEPNMNLGSPEEKLERITFALGGAIIDSMWNNPLLLTNPDAILKSPTQFANSGDIVGKKNEQKALYLFENSTGKLREFLEKEAKNILYATKIAKETEIALGKKQLRTEHYQESAAIIAADIEEKKEKGFLEKLGDKASGAIDWGTKKLKKIHKRSPLVAYGMVALSGWLLFKVAKSFVPEKKADSSIGKSGDIFDWFKGKITKKLLFLLGAGGLAGGIFASKVDMGKVGENIRETFSDFRSGVLEKMLYPLLKSFPLINDEEAKKMAHSLAYGDEEEKGKPDTTENDLKSPSNPEKVPPQPEREVPPNSLEAQAVALWEKIDKKGIFEDLTGFVKDTAVSLKNDVADLTRFNEFFPGINLEKGAMDTFMNYTPVALLKDLLEWGIGEEELLKWQEKGEKALWIGGGAFVGFKMLLGRNKKLYQTLGITFLVYGLYKKYEWAQEFIESPIKVPLDFYNSALPEDMRNSLEALDIYGFMESVEENNIPWMLVEGYGAYLYMAGKWIFVEPAKGYLAAMTDFAQGEFADGMTAIMAGQVPIMMTAAMRARLQGNSAMQGALRVNLLYLGATRTGRLSVDMFFRDLTQGKIARGARYLVENREKSIISRAHYLARKAAYYDRIGHAKAGKSKKALDNYLIDIAKHKDFMRGKEIPGIREFRDKEVIGVLIDPTERELMGNKLFRQAEAWVKRDGIIKRNTTVPLVDKAAEKFDAAKTKVKNKVSNTAETAKTATAEKVSSIAQKAKEKTTTYTKEKAFQAVEKSKEQMKKLGVKLEKQAIELQAALVSGDKLTIENVKIKYEETRSQMKKIAKKIPSKEMVHIETGKFAKTALKGGILVFTTLSAARLADFFMSEEVSSEEKTEMAKEIGKDLLPFVGTWRDRNRAIEEFADGEVSEAIKSTIFATLGAVSDVLLAAGVLTFGVSSVAGGSLRAGITAMKTARNATKLKKIVTGVTAGYAGMTILGLSELAWDRISQKDDLILGRLDEEADNNDLYDINVAV